MAKRGESRPWTVRWAWDNQVKGTSNHRSEDDAEFAAAEIRRNAETAPAALVALTVTRRPTR